MPVIEGRRVAPPRVSSTEWEHAPRVLVLDADGESASFSATAIAAAGLLLIGSYERSAAALAALEDQAVDVALVDPAAWGPGVIRELRAARPSTRVLAASLHAMLEHVLACLAAGAAGYVTKNRDGAQLAQQVQEAAQGHAPFSADVGTLLLPLLCERRGVRLPPSALTQRERQVLSLLSNGHTYGSVAAALGVGVGTVQSHVKNLYRKLEVCSKAEAVTVAVRQGLLTGPR